METEYCYSKMIVLGSGKLAYQCAMVGKSFLDNVEVLEYKVTESTVLQKLCEKEKMPYACCTAEQLYSRLMEETKQTLVVSAANTYLIPKAIIAKGNLRIVNWHNALLPRHRGRNAEAWSIYQGDDVTGITWHRLTEEVDTGDIIAQAEISIDDTMTALKLYQMQCTLGVQVFEQIMEDLLMDQCCYEKQAEPVKEQMHYSYEIPNGGWLDTEWDYKQINRFLRAMDYGALQLLGEMYVRWQGNTYSFSRYRITESAMPEDIVFREGDMVICREGHEIILKSLKKKGDTDL